MVMGMPSTVMDQLPTPRDISMVFVKQYYTLLNEAPDHVHRFYSQDSSFVHGGLERGKKSETKTAMGQKEINDRIQKLQFRDARTKIKQVDAHPTLAGGVVIQVSGQLSNNGAPMRPFMQTFVLAPQTTHNYYVYNDIFRYQDDLFSDDEDAGDGAADADDAEPESPPVPPPAAPAPAPAQPAAPPAEQPSAAAPTPYGQHMNGHGAAAPAPAPAPVEQQPTPPASPPPAPVAEPESQPEPESPPPPRQPSPPPPRQPSPPPVSTEPKTYANLLKASSGRPAAPRPAPPAASPATAAPAAQIADKDQSPPSRAPAARPTSAAGASRPPPPRDQTSDSGAASGGGGDGERRRYNVYPDNQQIFVGNLPLDVSEAELIEHFGTFGEVIGVRIHTSKAPPTKGLAPRNCPNYSFVVFDNPNAVNQVMQDMPVRMVRTGTEEELRLNIERKQQQRPPPGRGDRPMMEGGGRGRGFYSRGAPRGRGGGYGRGGGGGEARGGGRGGSYQAAPRR